MWTERNLVRYFAMALVLSLSCKKPGEHDSHSQKSNSNEDVYIADSCLGMPCDDSNSSVSSSEAPLLTKYGQFHLCGLPFSSEDLFFFPLHRKFHFPSIDVFDERNFEYYHIPLLQRDSIWRQSPSKYFPSHLFRGNGYDLIFLMRKENEAGYLEPVVFAYLLDNQRHRVSDSILVHSTASWEGFSDDLRFVLSQDSELILSHHETVPPQFMYEHAKDSVRWEPRRITETRYIIGKDLKFHKKESPSQ